MNDKQKWFIIIAVGCIGAFVWAFIAFISNPYSRERLFDIFLYDIDINWIGCILFGMLCSSITLLRIMK